MDHPPAMTGPEGRSWQAGGVVVDRASKVYRTRTGALRALREIDLRIEPGSFVSLLGPSGCGKSTLLALMAGLERPTSGQVFLDGKRVDEPYKLAGVIFQRDLLFEWKTALGNVLMQFEMRGIRGSVHRDRALELLGLVGLARFADKYPRELSGGMRQRVAWCRALVHDPKVLLMDEPFGALDALTRDQLNVDLSAIVSARGQTAIFVTHSIEEAVFLSDRVVVLSRGPGQVIADIEVKVAHPRTIDHRRDPNLQQALDRTRRVLYGEV